jgi:hypothetical protein
MRLQEEIVKGRDATRPHTVRYMDYEWDGRGEGSVDQHVVLESIRLHLRTFPF